MDPFIDLMRLSRLKVPATIPAHYWRWAWTQHCARKNRAAPTVDLRSIAVRSKPIRLGV
mgnify:FL=1